MVAPGCAAGSGANVEKGLAIGGAAAPASGGAPRGGGSWTPGGSGVMLADDPRPRPRPLPVLLTLEPTCTRHAPTHINIPARESMRVCDGGLRAREMYGFGFRR